MALGTLHLAGDEQEIDLDARVAYLCLGFGVIMAWMAIGLASGISPATASFMISFLFWNLEGQRKANRPQRAAKLLASVTSLARARHLDILLFAECFSKPNDVLAALNDAGVGNYTFPESRGQKLRVFTRLARTAIKEVYSDLLHDRLTIREIQAEGALPILLAGIHFYDRRTLQKEVDQDLVVTALASAIVRTEQATGHNRTVLVGDLNMNPFDGGVVGAQAFHAVMTRQLAQSVRRLRDRAAHPCFYDPMWSHFGGADGRPPGTYFFPPGLPPTNHFWNVFDQVLVRPDLMDSLSRVEVVDEDGREKLTTRRTGRPRRDLLSDHLPLFFELEM